MFERITKSADEEYWREMTEKIFKMQGPEKRCNIHYKPEIDICKPDGGRETNKSRIKHTL